MKFTFVCGKLVKFKALHVVDILYKSLKVKDLSANTNSTIRD